MNLVKLVLVLATSAVALAGCSSDVEEPQPSEQQQEETDFVSSPLMDRAGGGRCNGGQIFCGCQTECNTITNCYCACPLINAPCNI
jgi:hypothetical protein